MKTGIAKILLRKQGGKLILCGVVAVALLCFAGCDAHKDVPDTSTQIGHVLCTDGEVLSYSDFMYYGKKAIGVVFYINHIDSVEGNGYALYLWDVQDGQFAETGGSEQGTSADTSAYDGNENTYALYSYEDIVSPIANAVYDIWAYGQSAYIPSVAQMRLLYYAKDEVNAVLNKLGGDAIPDAADECWYWTSTEVDGQADYKAWLYSLASGAVQETPKTQTHRVRAIITLNE